MIPELIKTVFRPEITKMSAYKIAESKNLIKLDAMENPYTWPEEIKQQWLAELKDCALNRYPDPEAKQLATTLKHVNQIPKQSEILLGNGSDEIIQLLLMALSSTATVLAPSPEFVMYKQIALSLGLNYQSVPLLENSFELDLDAMLEAIKKYQPEVIFLAYPNNPTANLFDIAAIETIISTATGLVIIDEAYAPFADASFMNKLPQYSNLLVMRTVSKLGLAGLRLGFIAGNKTIIEQLNKIRLPYNINILTQLTANFALNKAKLFQQQTQQICQDRAIVSKQLKQLDSLTVYPSAANFILFKTAKNQATQVFEQLKQQGILIKNLSPQGGVLTDCLRVTIGKPKENQYFIKELTVILKTTL